MTPTKCFYSRCKIDNGKAILNFVTLLLFVSELLAKKYRWEGGGGRVKLNPTRANLGQVKKSFLFWNNLPHRFYVSLGH